MLYILQDLLDIKLTRYLPTLKVYHSTKTLKNILIKSRIIKNICNI